MGDSHPVLRRRTVAALHIGTRLFSIALSMGADEKHPVRQLAGVLRQPKYPWRDRFDFLAQNLLNSTRVAFFFDNFEDNLKEGVPPEELDSEFPLDPFEVRPGLDDSNPKERPKPPEIIHTALCVEVRDGQLYVAGLKGWTSSATASCSR